MATLYVASTETFVGKSAICAALLNQFQQRGHTVGYMKPVSVSVTQTEDGAIDQDAQLMRELFDLQESSDQIAPILATTRLIEGVLRGDTADYRSKLQEAFNVVGQGKEVVVLEGANTWAEGALLGLSADQVSDLLDAPVLLINRFRSTAAVDIIMAVQRYLGSRLIGVVLNQVFDSQFDYVKQTVVPFLEQANIAVLGMIPRDTQIEAPSVQDVVEHLDVEVVSDGDHTRLVENLSVGAMSAESALTFFRRKPNKAVITGGDRADLQIAALETSTSCLILTGNMRPHTTVLDRAAQRQVPVLLTPSDTLTTVQQIETIMGQVRFSGAKRERFNQLAGQHIDMDRLSQLVGLTAK
jgi:BioD-like phosphotransacetylase family protein